jgi:hypothetical protein
MLAKGLRVVIHQLLAASCEMYAYHQLDAKISTSTYVTHVGARWKTCSRVDQTARETEQIECYSNTVQTCKEHLPQRRMLQHHICESLLHYAVNVVADCSGLDAA